jgi:hypothetical protein
MVLSSFYLRRLRRFARLSHRPDAASDPEMQRLTGQAMLAAYRDCVALGLELEARDVLDRVVGRRVVSI